MGSTRGPIHSAYDDDPAHADAIDAFVVALAECVDDLQDLELRGDFHGLAERASELAASAQRVGYPPLADVAESAAAAARDRNADLAYKAMIELTDLAQRVRSGHRGSL